MALSDELCNHLVNLVSDSLQSNQFVYGKFYIDHSRSSTHITLHTTTAIFRGYYLNYFPAQIVCSLLSRKMTTVYPANH